MNDILKSLIDIVGDKGVSNAPEELWFYARDPGVLSPHNPDYVVAPKTTEQVQKIVQLANREKIPIVPMGNGMALTGLVIPLKGGIVLDMKRMNKILEVNEKARYAVVEGGTSQGVLKAYLQEHYPHLRHSIPDAPPTTTIAANVALHGQGRLTNQYGFNSDMVTGMEIVLPTGEICLIGSPSLGPYWFSKGPTLPDLSGLFLGWLGATGVITKMGLRLYPNKKIREVEMFVTDKVELVPEILYKLTHLEILEDVNVWFQPKPLMFVGNFHVTIYFNGDTEEEIEFKRKMIWDSLQEFIDSKDGGFMNVQYMKGMLLQMPQRGIADFADVPKGGGFEYSGPITIIEHFPQYAAKVVELAKRYDILYASSARLISGGHCMMFSISFAFNRSNPGMMKRVKEALDEATTFALEMGGIPWKPNFMEQKMTMKKMDPNALNLLQMIKKNLDPEGIMNPGNWEVN
ncbi:MAG TPA: FAD-binding oxidoreductase [Smithellaceae bacterium]|jgi:glycolate oxidase|nr:FAD-binding oxidoreductase [Syntrophaceae bacterium]MDX9816424.1 FAD-binding oxidoreductase [Smithellaceae bacterium]NMD05156.1 FAD-binding oxidoreductase [Deltaproteobacteria bacterium]OPZ52369.1 MAG: putative FAD-linked oxidoreductase [Deltaproteobacteria bacterium ADurb.BinA014]HNQ19294.1 FAD-binding oxidoreductase [Smithellaceae bacterium]